jgi:hypothetical protein
MSPEKREPAAPMADWITVERRVRNDWAHMGGPPSSSDDDYWARFAAAADGAGEPLTWELVNSAALARGGGGEFSLPEHVLRLFHSLTAGLGAQRLLDPFTRVPALVGSLVDGGPADHGVAVVGPEWQTLVELMPSAVTWVVGDLPGALEGAVAPQSVDLVVSAPPLGAPIERFLNRAPGSETDEWSTGRGQEVWHWLARRTAPALAKGGRMAFLVNEGMLFRGRAGASALDDLAACGLHLQAAVSVPQGFGRMTGLQAALVIFGTESTETIFTALAPPDQDPAQVISNLLAHQPGRVPELGHLVQREDYKGWAALQSQLDLERELRVPAGMRVTLGDIAVGITRLALQQDDDVTAHPGTVLYIHEVTGKASLDPPEVTGKGPVRCYEVAVDLERAMPAYLVWWINTPLGKLSRASQNDGRHIPRLSREGVARLPFPLPSLDEQRAAVALQARSAELSAELQSIDRELAARPVAARDLNDRLDGLWSDPTSIWASRLPFPLASILDRYTAIAEIDVSARRKRLRHFFQAFAVFGVSLLLPAYQRGDDDWASHLQAITSGTRDGSNPFVSPTFGSWVEIGSALAKALRRERSRLGKEMGDGHAAHEVLFGIPDVDFADELAATSLWNALRRAKDLRNDSSHDRVLTKQEEIEHLSALQDVLEEVRDATPRCFFRTAFVVPGESRFDGGINTYSRAKHLAGPSQNFREGAVESLKQLESGSLYVISRSTPVVRDALRVAPFVQLLPAPAHEANTVYFANGMTADGRFDMVSYHTESPTAQRSEDLPELSGFLAAIRDPPPDFVGGAEAS